MDPITPDSTIVECPLCGRKNTPNNTFRCRKCAQENLCLRHQVAETLLCVACASKGKSVVETTSSCGHQDTDSHSPQKESISLKTHQEICCAMTSQEQLPHNCKTNPLVREIAIRLPIIVAVGLTAILIDEHYGKYIAISTALWYRNISQKIRKGSALRWILSIGWIVPYIITAAPIVSAESNDDIAAAVVIGIVSFGIYYAIVLWRAVVES